MSNDAIGLFILAAGLALIAWAVYGQLAKNPAAPLADKFAMISQAVAAAEQLYRSRQMEPEQRLDYALDLIEKWYPEMDIDTAKAHIEAAVFWLKEHGGQIVAPGELPPAAEHRGLRN